MIEQHRRKVVSDQLEFRGSLPGISSHARRAVQAQGVGVPANGGGTIINIASVQGLQSQKAVPAYAAAKGGVLSLTRQMAMCYGEYGIRVNAISPGTIRTPLVEALIKGAGSTMEQAGSVYPLQGRVGEPSEVGDVAVFLASGKASFITGENLVSGRAKRSGLGLVAASQRRQGI